MAQSLSIYNNYKFVRLKKADVNKDIKHVFHHNDQHREELQKQHIAELVFDEIQCVERSSDETFSQVFKIIYLLKHTIKYTEGKTKN